MVPTQRGEGQENDGWTGRGETARGLGSQTEELYQCGAISDVLCRELMESIFVLGK